MSTARFSTKGQIVIPKEHRDAYAFNVGSEVEFVPEADGLKMRLRKKGNAQPTTIAEISGMLTPLYNGPVLSAEEISDRIKAALQLGWPHKGKNTS